MPTFIIHNNVEIVNRVLAASVDDVATGEGLVVIEAIDPWDGYIGQAVTGGGVIPDPPPPTPTLEEQLKKLQVDHYSALDALVYDFGDGRIIQTRPRDRNNFKEAFDIGKDRKWLMADNVPKWATIVELQTAYESGKAQADALWDKLMVDIETILGV